jgi:hypothetical protein
MKTVSLTPDYRITSDGERNFTLEERHIVDPTKSPNFARLNLAAIAETGTALSTAKREEWRDIGNYGFHAAGLTALLSFAALRTAWKKDSGVDALTVGDFAADVADEYHKLREAVDGKFTEVNV